MDANKNNAVSKESEDSFYSESNIRYLEKIVKDIRDGRAHFTEHELIEED